MKIGFFFYYFPHMSFWECFWAVGTWKILKNEDFSFVMYWVVSSFYVTWECFEGKKPLKGLERTVDACVGGDGCRRECICIMSEVNCTLVNLTVSLLILFTVVSVRPGHTNPTEADIGTASFKQLIVLLSIYSIQCMRWVFTSLH